MEFNHYVEEYVEFFTCETLPEDINIFEHPIQDHIRTMCLRNLSIIASSKSPISQNFHCISWLYPNLETIKLSIDINTFRQNNLTIFNYLPVEECEHLQILSVNIYDCDGDREVDDRDKLELKPRLESKFKNNKWKLKELPQYTIRLPDHQTLSTLILSAPLNITFDIGHMPSLITLDAKNANVGSFTQKEDEMQQLRNIHLYDVPRFNIYCDNLTIYGPMTRADYDKLREVTHHLSLPDAYCSSFYPRSNFCVPPINNLYILNALEGDHYYMNYTDEDEDEDENEYTNLLKNRIYYKAFHTTIILKGKIQKYKITDLDIPCHATKYLMNRARLLESSGTCPVLTH